MGGVCAVSHGPALTAGGWVEWQRSFWGEGVISICSSAAEENCKRFVYIRSDEIVFVSFFLLPSTQMFSTTFELTSDKAVIYFDVLVVV